MSNDENTLPVKGSREEIQQALKAFEIQNSALPKKPVVEKVTVSIDPEAPKMVQLVMKYSGGAIKNQRTAEYVLLVLALLMLAVSVYLFFGGHHSVQQSVVPPSGPIEKIPVIR